MSERAKRPLFDLNRSDDRFIEMATEASARDDAIRRLVSSRKVHIAILALACGMTIWSLFRSEGRAFAVAFLALALATLNEVDIKIKLLKVLRHLEGDAGRGVT